MITAMNPLKPLLLYWGSIEFLSRIKNRKACARTTNKSIVAIYAVDLTISRNCLTKDWKKLKIFKKLKSCKFSIKTTRISINLRV